MIFIIQAAAAAYSGSGGSSDSTPPGDYREPSPERPFKVLIVDDDQDIHEALDDIISDEAILCSVKHTYNGQEALEEMKRDCPDLLILDLRMPVMDGLALREEMLHDPALINVQIAVFTGHAMNTTELQVLLADFYLPKPATVDSLLEVLMKARTNLLTMGERTRKRAEAAVHRLSTIIGDLSTLRDSLAAKLKKP